MTENAPHYLYRCYDADGVLLYVGCTSEPKKRLATHRRGDRGASRWLAVTMVRSEVDCDIYPNRDSGLEAEAEAIEIERPVFNFQHNIRSGRWGWQAAHYLVDHGHLQLALDTACTCWRESKSLGKCDPWCYAHVSEGALEVFRVGEVA
jgi:predicted GIY-YIG superfamily endonuclease